jgi:siderophore synthetase component
MTTQTLPHAAPADVPLDGYAPGGIADGTTAGSRGAGGIAFRPVDAAADAVLLHSWIATEHARFWGMPDAGLDEVRAEYERIGADAHHHALIGLRAGRPAFLLETYAPERSALAGRYLWRDGDAGLHLLLPAPKPGDSIPGFGAAAMRASLAHLFADPAVLRVVVEPDARNAAVQSLNARLGFRPQERVRLPGGPGSPAKTAQLSFCDRRSFAEATGLPSTVTAHLSPERWAAANRHVLAKAIAEFSHERLLAPTAEPDGGWRISAGARVYRFAATTHALQHWSVDPASLLCDLDGVPVRPDAQEFVVAFREDLGLSDEQLPVYLEELGSTLAGHCYKQLHSSPTSAEMASGTGDALADFQRIEASMTEGHPCFVANNGRLGLGAGDYLDFAPETGSPVRLEWVAAHSSRAAYSHVAELDHERLLEQELGAETVTAFRNRLAAACAGTGLDPADFLLLPVHPWQWENRLAVTFAGDVASRHLVHLGAGADLYQPQQSIRTFFNRSNPGRRYVKTALSVLNMGFLRGLSAKYMEATPAINEWLDGLVRDDGELRERRVGLLREVAAVGYTNPLFQAATKPASAYRKMLAALWRESPADRIDGDESLATMASLLHVDAHGRSFAAALVRHSGLTGRQWLARYFDAYLVPLVHCLVAHDLVFMPHGENVILVLRDGAPDRMLLKDLAEEIAVVGDRTPLPDAVSRIRADVAPEDRVLSVFTDVVDCFLRFLAPLLEREGVADAGEFWGTAAERLDAYRTRHPELAAEFDALGLFEERFRLSCLNRLQLRNNQSMLDLADPAGSLIYAGTLANPLAEHRGS